MHLSRGAVTNVFDGQFGGDEPPTPQNRKGAGSTPMPLARASADTSDHDASFVRRGQRSPGDEFADELLVDYLRGRAALTQIGMTGDIGDCGVDLNAYGSTGVDCAGCTAWSMTRREKRSREIGALG